MNVVILKGKPYEIAKWVTLVVLPALGTLYVTLAGIWGTSNFPHPDEVSQTVLAVNLFLGLVLGISKLNYDNSEERFDGTAFVDRLDPTNNPDVMLKAPNFAKAPKQLVLRVQETAPVPGGGGEHKDVA